MLEDKIKHYELMGNILYTDPADYKEKYPFLKEIDSRALLYTRDALTIAYKNFFRKSRDFQSLNLRKAINKVILLV